MKPSSVAAVQAHSKPCFHPAYVRVLCAVLRAEGADVDAVLARAGISWAGLECCEELLPLRVVRGIILGAQRVATRPTLALEVGAQMQLASHGAIGYCLSVSANLRQALEVLVRFMPYRSRAVRPILHVAADGAWVILEPCIPLGDVRAFVLDCIAASFSGLISAVSGRRPRDAILEVPWAPPAWRRAYDGLAGTVRFGTGRMAYWMPNLLLDAPCPTAAPSAFASAWRECEAQERIEKARYTLMARVEALLRQTASPARTLSAAAAALGLSPRTLNRRLKNEGTSFHALLEGVRRQQAIWDLRHTDATVAHIAANLGYRDSSNFSRTFRRWFNATPAAMREGLAAWPPESNPSAAGSQNDKVHTYSA
jgi:AraC-like DNA-binding protein